MLCRRGLTTQDDSEIRIAVSTCCEVPTVGWINLKRTHARCHCSGAMTGDQLVVWGISWFGCEANEPPKCQSYTAADNQASHDQGYGWTLYITIREYLSVQVLVRSCTVALFHWNRCRWCHLNLLPRTYVQVHPYPLILPTPPLLLQLLLLFFYFS